MTAPRPSRLRQLRQLSAVTPLLPPWAGRRKGAAMQDTPPRPRPRSCPRVPAWGRALPASTARCARHAHRALCAGTFVVHTDPPPPPKPSPWQTPPVSAAAGPTAGPGSRSSAWGWTGGGGWGESMEPNRARLGRGGCHGARTRPWGRRARGGGCRPRGWTLPGAAEGAPTGPGPVPPQGAGGPPPSPNLHPDLHVVQRGEQAQAWVGRCWAGVPAGPWERRWAS